MNKIKVLNSFLLLITAIIWGTAFVAQRAGMDFMGPFTFGFWRFILGGMVLIPVIQVQRRIERKLEKDTIQSSEQKKQTRKNTLLGGLFCGFVIFAASSLQQIAIKDTTAGKAGFITALYIIAVPVLGVFLKRKISGLVGLGIVIATIGLYFLCIPKGEAFGFSNADRLLLWSALLFGVHILVIGFYSPKGKPITISCIQFFIGAALSAICMFLFEEPTFASLRAGIIPVVYTGVLSSGVAYTLQIVAQKHVEPTIASLVMSMEAVVAAVAAWIILDESMNAREISGAALLFFAVILAQLPVQIFYRKKRIEQEKRCVEEVI